MAWELFPPSSWCRGAAPDRGRPVEQMQRPVRVIPVEGVMAHGEARVGEAGAHRGLWIMLPAPGSSGVPSISSLSSPASHGWTGSRCRAWMVVGSWSGSGRVGCREHEEARPSRDRPRLVSLCWRRSTDGPVPQTLRRLHDIVHEHDVARGSEELDNVSPFPFRSADCTPPTLNLDRYETGSWSKPCGQLPSRGPLPSADPGSIPATSAPTARPSMNRFFTKPPCTPRRGRHPQAAARTAGVETVRAEGTARRYALLRFDGDP